MSSDQSSTTIPTINLSSKNRKETVERIRQACLATGFFYLDGHGIPSTFLQEVFSQTKALFDLPLEEKQALSDKEMSRGYTAFEEEVLDPSKQKHRGDTKEGYYIAKHVPKDSPDFDPAKFRGPNVYPTTTTGSSLIDADKFRRTMDEYHTLASQVGLEVTRLLASALNLPENYFDFAFKESPLALLRLLHYSSEVSCPEKGIFAAGAHSDYGMITLLLTDSNPGLEILLNGKDWTKIPPREGVFVVNLGDMLEVWTNGLFKSTTHRVVSTSKNERFSIPFFYEPNFDTVVECLDTCWNENNPKKYASIKSGEFLINKYLATHKDFDPASTKQ